ncbi:MAG: 50S ribosomal protein L18 [archaeon]|nr:50S ribosomal protein L18 [archaeon]MCP8314330.1 50S ribosomal protein L18 [archaeon]MCP8319506.1 50S ribosomal protein L18 [archaeon]
MNDSYAPIIRRRREGKTNYRKRRAIILSRLPFVYAFISGKNILVQILSPQKEGDVALASAHSRELIKFGWMGSRKNIPAAYLTGLLAGLKAKDKVDEAILYIGLRRFVPNSRITAVVKGLLDAGVSISIDHETLPSEERLKGKHIADYAKYLLEKDKVLYNERFSSLISKALKPESIPEHFKDVRKKIMEGFEVRKA